MSKKRKGFTLIELMIVVAIIGILAAVAIPSFLRFIRQSKYSEAPINLRAMANGAIAWLDAEHTDTDGSPMAGHYPTSASPTALPSPSISERNVLPVGAPCSEGGSLYAKNSQRWNAQPWQALKFSINKAHYFQYVYDTHGYIGATSNPDFIVAGFADLDCDGSTISYVMQAPKGTFSNGLPQLTEIFIMGLD